MLVTLALVVFCASIAVFFSQEFIHLFKKIFAIQIVALTLPLLIASWLLFTFDYWLVEALSFYRDHLQHTLQALMPWIPSTKAQSIAIVILLTALAVLPVRLMDFILRKRNYHGYPYPYITSTFIWLISAMALFVL